MTDIVKRLRGCLRPAGYAMTITNVETIQEAATEIEQLRERLRAVLLHVAELRAQLNEQQP